MAGVTGVLAAGLVVLAVLVLATQVWAWVNGYPGPGILRVVAHVAAAGIAVAAQLVVDRRPGGRAALCQVAICVVTLAVLLGLWWF